MSARRSNGPRSPKRSRGAPGDLSAILALWLQLRCVQMIGKSKSAKSETAAAPNWHLATTDDEAALSELEWTLLRWYESYSRLARESLARAGNSAVSPQEVMILHVIRMHDRPKTSSMIANLLNRTDIQNLQYSTRKLIAQKLVSKVKSGRAKSAALTATPAGKKLCDDLAEFRRTMLLDSLQSLEDLPGRLRATAKTASMLTALYDQAERESVRPPAISPRLPGPRG